VKSKLDGRPPNGQAGNSCLPPSCAYGPAEFVAASWRSEGCLEHSTRKSAIANKTAMATQITTLLAWISIAVDAASDMEMGFVIHVELPPMTVDRLSNVSEQLGEFRWLHHPVVRLRP
jgi:hypothetical protein